MTNDLKLKLYPAIIGVLGACLAASLLSHFEVQVWTESDRVRVPVAEQSPIDSATPAPPPALVTPSAAPAVPIAAPPDGARGSLRISNPTQYPVRIALLSQAEPDRNEQPVHWDFAPGEGKVKGLKVSLPDGTLQIEAGDILVAFAQDGSRRYWGPYVAGQTQLPSWNPTAEEWQLNLQP